MNAGALFGIAALALLFAGYCYVAKLLAQLRHDRGDDIAEGDWPHVPAELNARFHSAPVTDERQPNHGAR